MPVPLNYRLTRTYWFIYDYVQAHGYCPSGREIAEGTGLKSVSTATYRLGQLEKYGYIERARNQSRSIRLLVPLDSEWQDGVPQAPSSGRPNAT